MQNSTRRSARTVLQFAVGVATALPLMLAEPGVAEALPWLIPAAAVAGAAARVMSVPAVQRWLPVWLQVPLDPDDQLRALTRRDRP
ncbi:hypothetical protein ACFY3G_17910 [Streptomyces phaeochromogenes]|uniref:hypothetical protein n=1 Tax=Streptomyces phaeochromogenes TaxID=1923 RepID=UPI0036B74E96